MLPVKFAHLLQVLRERSGQIGRTEQAADPVGPLRLPRERVALRGLRQIVQGASGMGVEIEKALLLALHRPDELQQQGMLEHIGEIARMEMMAVVHFRLASRRPAPRASAEPARN